MLRFTKVGEPVNAHNQRCKNHETHLYNATGTMQKLEPHVKVIVKKGNVNDKVKGIISVLVSIRCFYKHKFFLYLFHVRCIKPICVGFDDKSLHNFIHFIFVQSERGEF